MRLRYKTGLAARIVFTVRSQPYDIQFVLLIRVLSSEVSIQGHD